MFLCQLVLLLVSLLPFHVRIKCVGLVRKTYMTSKIPCRARGAVRSTAPPWLLLRSLSFECSLDLIVMRNSKMRKSACRWTNGLDPHHEIARHGSLFMFHVIKVIIEPVSSGHHKVVSSDMWVSWEQSWNPFGYGY